MYVISNNIRNKFYSGGLQYTPLLYIGETQIQAENIKSISFDDPVYDKQSEVMYIGTFISKKLEIELRTTQELDLTEPINFSIQVYDEQEEETVTIPIGIFNIETSPSDYYKSYKIRRPVLRAVCANTTIKSFFPKNDPVFICLFDDGQ